MKTNRTISRDAKDLIIFGAFFLIVPLIIYNLNFSNIKILVYDVFQIVEERELRFEDVLKFEKFPVYVDESSSTEEVTHIVFPIYINISKGFIAILEKTEVYGGDSLIGIINHQKTTISTPQKIEIVIPLNLKELKNEALEFRTYVVLDGEEFLKIWSKYKNTTERPGVTIKTGKIVLTKGG